MTVIRERWLGEVNEVLIAFRIEVEAQLKTTVTMKWDMTLDVVEPDVKVASKLEHHLPFVIPNGHKKKAHLTDSKSVAVEIIRKTWDRYRVVNKELFDYQLWIKANVVNATAELSNEDFAEIMRLKRNAEAKTDS